MMPGSFKKIKDCFFFFRFRFYSILLSFILLVLFGVILTFSSSSSTFFVNYQQLNNDGLIVDDPDNTQSKTGGPDEHGNTINYPTFKYKLGTNRFLTDIYIGIGFKFNYFTSSNLDFGSENTDSTFLIYHGYYNSNNLPDSSFAGSPTETGICADNSQCHRYDFDFTSDYSVYSFRHGVLNKIQSLTTADTSHGPAIYPAYFRLQYLVEEFNHSPSFSTIRDNIAAYKNYRANNPSGFYTYASFPSTLNLNSFLDNGQMDSAKNIGDSHLSASLSGEEVGEISQGMENGNEQIKLSDLELGIAIDAGNDAGLANTRTQIQELLTSPIYDFLYSPIDAVDPNLQVEGGLKKAYVTYSDDSFGSIIGLNEQYFDRDGTFNIAASAYQEMSETEKINLKTKINNFIQVGKSPFQIWREETISRGNTGFSFDASIATGKPETRENLCGISVLPGRPSNIDEILKLNSVDFTSSGIRFNEFSGDCMILDETNDNLLFSMSEIAHFGYGGLSINPFSSPTEITGKDFEGISAFQAAIVIHYNTQTDFTQIREYLGNIVALNSLPQLLPTFDVIRGSGNIPYLDGTSYTYSFDLDFNSLHGNADGTLTLDGEAEIFGNELSGAGHSPLISFNIANPIDSLYFLKKLLGMSVFIEGAITNNNPATAARRKVLYLNAIQNYGNDSLRTIERNKMGMIAHILQQDDYTVTLKITALFFPTFVPEVVNGSELFTSSGNLNNLNSYANTLSKSLQIAYLLENIDTFISSFLTKFAEEIMNYGNSQSEKVEAMREYRSRYFDQENYDGFPPGLSKESFETNGQISLSALTSLTLTELNTIGLGVRTFQPTDIPPREITVREKRTTLKNSGDTSEEFANSRALIVAGKRATQTSPFSVDFALNLGLTNLDISNFNENGTLISLANNENFDSLPELETLENELNNLKANALFQSYRNQIFNYGNLINSNSQRNRQPQLVIDYLMLAFAPFNVLGIPEITELTETSFIDETIAPFRQKILNLANENLLNTIPKLIAFVSGINLVFALPSDSIPSQVNHPHILGNEYRTAVLNEGNSVNYGNKINMIASFKSLSQSPTTILINLITVSLSSLTLAHFTSSGMFDLSRLEFASSDGNTLNKLESLSKGMDEGDVETVLRNYRSAIINAGNVEANSSFQQIISVFKTLSSPPPEVNDLMLSLPELTGISLSLFSLNGLMIDNALDDIDDIEVLGTFAYGGENFDTLQVNDYANLIQAQYRRETISLGNENEAKKLAIKNYLHLSPAPTPAYDFDFSEDLNLKFFNFDTGELTFADFANGSFDALLALRVGISNFIPSSVPREAGSFSTAPLSSIEIRNGLADPTQTSQFFVGILSLTDYYSVVVKGFYDVTDSRGEVNSFQLNGLTNDGNQGISTLVSQPTPVGTNLYSFRDSIGNLLTQIATDSNNLPDNVKNSLPALGFQGFREKGNTDSAYEDKRTAISLYQSFSAFEQNYYFNGPLHLNLNSFNADGTLKELTSFTSIADVAGIYTGDNDFTVSALTTFNQENLELQTLVETIDSVGASVALEPLRALISLHKNYFRVSTNTNNIPLTLSLPSLIGTTFPYDLFADDGTISRANLELLFARNKNKATAFQTGYTTTMTLAFIQTKHATILNGYRADIGNFLHNDVSRKRLIERFLSLDMKGNLGVDFGFPDHLNSELLASLNGPFDVTGFDRFDTFAQLNSMKSFLQNLDVSTQEVNLIEQLKTNLFHYGATESRLYNVRSLLASYVSLSEKPHLIPSFDFIAAPLTIDSFTPEGTLKLSTFASYTYQHGDMLKNLLNNGQAEPNPSHEATAIQSLLDYATAIRNTGRTNNAGKELIRNLFYLDIAGTVPLDYPTVLNLGFTQLREMYRLFFTDSGNMLDSVLGINVKWNDFGKLATLQKQIENLSLIRENTETNLAYHKLILFRHFLEEIKEKGNNNENFARKRANGKVYAALPLNLQTYIFPLNLELTQLHFNVEGELINFNFARTFAQAKETGIGLNNENTFHDLPLSLLTPISSSEIENCQTEVTLLCQRLRFIHDGNTQQVVMQNVFTYYYLLASSKTIPANYPNSLFRAINNAAVYDVSAGLSIHDFTRDGKLRNSALSNSAITLEIMTTTIENGKIHFNSILHLNTFTRHQQIKILEIGNAANYMNRKKAALSLFKTASSATIYTGYPAAFRFPESLTIDSFTDEGNLIANSIIAINDLKKLINIAHGIALPEATLLGLAPENNELVDVMIVARANKEAIIANGNEDENKKAILRQYQTFADGVASIEFNFPAGLSLNNFAQDGTLIDIFSLNEFPASVSVSPFDMISFGESVFNVANVDSNSILTGDAYFASLTAIESGVRNFQPTDYSSTLITQQMNIVLAYGNADNKKAQLRRQIIIDAKTGKRTVNLPAEYSLNDFDENGQLKANILNTKSLSFEVLESLLQGGDSTPLPKSINLPIIIGSSVAGGLLCIVLIALFLVQRKKNKK